MKITDVLLEIQLSIFMSILLLVTLIHSYLKFSMDKLENRIFFTTEVLIFILLILEIFSVFYDKTNVFNSIEIHKIINVLGFALAPIPIFLMWMFLNQWVSRKIDKKLVLALAIPIILNLIISILSYRNDFIFNVDVNNEYERGRLFFTSPVISGFYFALNFIWMLKNKSKIHKDERITFGLSLFIPMILGIIQVKYSIFLTIWNSWALAITMMYIFILYEKTKRDPLTGLENRQAYYSYISKLQQKNNVILTVINIDMDNFKSINDNYGHNEGDEAIKSFGNIIKRVFTNKEKSMRIGGDEFIIFIEDNDKVKVGKYIEELIRIKDIYNKENMKPYTIEFSYGIGIYDKNNETIDQLIKRCDSKMYEQKRQKGLYTK